MNQTSSSISDIIAPLIGLLIVFGLWKALFQSSSSRRAYTSRPSRGTAATRRRELQMIRQNIGPVPFGRLSFMDTSAPPVSRHHALIPAPTVTSANLADHPYEDMTLDNLHNHLYEKHFEVLNLLAEKNPLPARWHREHVDDHYGRGRR